MFFVCKVEWETYGVQDTVSCCKTNQQPGHLMWRIHLVLSSHPHCYCPSVAACLPDKVSS